MIRLICLCFGILLTGAAVAAQDRLTPEETAEIVGMLDAMITGSAEYARAEDLARQAEALILEDFGEDSRQAIAIRRIRVMTAALQGRHEQAAGMGLWLARKAQQVLPPDDPLFYRVVAAYAVTLRLTGKPAEALSLASQAVTEADRYLPAGSIAGDELRLYQALLAVDLGDGALAEQAFRRLEDRLADRADPGAMALRATGLAGWAELVANRGDAAQAAALFEAAIAAMDARYADLKHPRLVPARLAATANLAEALIQSGRDEEVAPLITPVLTEVEAVYGPDAPFWADLAFPLAIALASDGSDSPELSRATALMSRVVAIREEVYAYDTRDLLRARINLAMLLSAAGRNDAALDQIDRLQGVALPGYRAQIVYVLATAEQAGALGREAAVEQVLYMLQRSQTASAAAAQQLLSDRLAAGSDRASAALRDRSDALSFLDTAQARMVAYANRPAGQRDPATGNDLQRQLQEARRAADAAHTRLETAHPDAAAATGGLVASLADIHAALAADEALIIVDSPTGAEDAGLIVAVSRDALDWRTFGATATEVTEAVASLRSGIGLQLGLRSAAALDDTPETSFDYHAAHFLYAQTVGQVRDVLRGKSHLRLDLRGALSAVPPQMLLATPFDGDDPGAADWLIRHHAISVLPAVSALLTPPIAATGEQRPLLAFADPDFGTLAPDTDLALRGGLSPLPETATEVREVARALGAGTGSVHLQDAASEAAVKSAPLAQAGLLYFATHGLITGDAVGAADLREPALALTPGAGEDGLLTASEISQLTLDARLVVLSACNTAMGDRPGADALSGLAQAFIYAGARSLMVSHWPVESHSTVALMTGMFNHLSTTPGLSHPQAQRAAILAMLNDPERAEWRHPAYWAPFVLVGAAG